MPDGAHDMSLMSLLVNGIAHGFAVNSQSCVVFGILFVPLSDGAVDMFRIHAHEAMADGVEARYDVFVVLVSASKASAGFFLEVLRPVGESLIALHAAQGGASGNG